MQAQDRLNDITSDTNNAPAMFVGHGSPMVAIEFDSWNEKICDFVENIPDPIAIVVMSAHWTTEDGVHITSSRLPEQKYDFSREDYPETLFHLTYPCEGQPQLASDIARMLEERGINSVLDEEAGLDHGTWVPLYVAFPNMDIPVVQISMPDNSTPEEILEIGRTLSSLRDRGVLLMGSGNIVNNKNYADLDDKYAKTDEWAEDFDDWFEQQLGDFELDDLLEYQKLAPHADKAVASESHILPLFFVLGGLLKDDYYVNLFEGFHYGNISMRSFALVSNQ